MRFLGASLAASMLLTLAASAGAQAVPPDVVRLQDGSMYRGTISELVAGDHVVIVGADGQSHRFPMKDVASAGPSTAAPASIPPPPPPPPPGGPPAGPADLGGPPAQVHFEANEADVQLQLRTGQAEIVGWGWGGRGAVAYGGQAREYKTICSAAPCTATLPVGTHRLGLALEGKNTVEPTAPVVVTGPGTLNGTYTSHTGTRVAGLLVLLGGVGAGAALAFTSFHAGGSSCDAGADGTCTYTAGSFDGTRFALGTGVMVVGSLVGLVLMLQRDSVELTFVPMAAGWNVGPREMQRAPAGGPQGLALQARF